MPLIPSTQDDDVLIGTSGNDVIDDFWGDDVINTGDGDDAITDRGGSNTILSGAGNDFISLRVTDYGATVYDYANVVRSNLIDAGDGNDVVQVYNYGTQTLTINLGSGADLLTFNTVGWGVTTSVTTGAGADRIVLDWNAGDALRSIDVPPAIITDFTAGNGGDVLDLGEAIEAMLRFNPHAANPFVDGHLVLVQDGADVIVRIDVDGSGGGSGNQFDRDVFRLTNVTVADLTAYNLAGYDPNGGSLTHTTVNGTNASEWLSANVGGSDVNGLGGNDLLTGNFGDDTLNGGAGNDILKGGSGNDTLVGGTENDTLDGGAGNDVLQAGDGDDVISDPSGTDTIDAGAGNDTIETVRVGNLGNVTINAGDGNDFVHFDNDRPNHVGGTLTVDLGAGNDIFVTPGYLDAVQLTLGAGQDRVVFSRFGPTIVITDFTAGNGGDILELDLFSGGGGANPFATGYLFLQQDGADTLVVSDYDGAGPGTSYLTLARLVNVNAGSLTAFNFGGYAPDGSPSSYTVAQGTSGNDHLYGSIGADVINGGDGNDLIEELKGGSDTLNGGNGDDTIILSHYVPWGASETVNINSGTGSDTVDVAYGSSGHLNVDLGADNDRLLIRGLGDGGTNVTLGAGSDVIEMNWDTASTGNWPLTILDFQTGDGGDRLDWATYAEQKCFDGSADFNPFYEGLARLVQVGGDVQLQLATKQVTGEPIELWTTVMTFNATSVASFTAYNLGYDLYLPTQSGGSGDDTLNGTAGLDVLYGNAGNDTLNGLDGNDNLWGHDGNDTMNGGAGIDFLRGGTGNDVLHGDAGADNLDGGTGVDTLDGGDGDDTIFDWEGSSIITGGAGNDTIKVSLYFNNANGVGFGTLSAGDGNDYVEILNSWNQTGYAVDLGAGDDVIHMIHHPGQITLGAGRDTVLWETSYNVLGNGTLVLTDFQAGDAGDIFDVMTFLKAPLGLYSEPYFYADFNPFTSGYLELRQVGNDVEMYLHRDGYDDSSQYNDPPVVRFLNTNLAQLTAANFGGRDPHAPPNVTTVVSGDLTIGPNDVVIAHNVTAVNGLSAAFTFGFGVSAVLTNHGTITSVVDSPWPAGSAAGFSNGPAPGGGSFLNASDGELHVHSELLDNTGVISLGQTFGIYAEGYGSPMSLQNDGLIDVTATSGVAVGVYSGLSPFTNTGSLTVESAYDAYGFFSANSPNFVNTGSITVHGDDYAEGVHLGDITSSGFNNAGTITVTTDPDSPYPSIGVYLGGRSGAIYHHYNSGTITADIALFADAYARTGPGAYQIVDYVHNSGTINGAIMLAAGNDVVINTGTISGRTLLEDGDDQYDGTGGLHFGTVEGGIGNDTLSGGAFTENFYGDDGNDTLIGNGGDDFLEGGAGDDLIDGGSGFDAASYSEATGGVTVSLAIAATQNTGGAGADTLTGIEDLIGSTFADTLSGNATGNYLYGNDGNDVLFGGAGADVLSGNAGNDTFRDTASGLNGDTITDLTFGDKIVITDATLTGFTFNLSGNTLTYTGGALTLQGSLTGTLMASAAPGGGVQIILAQGTAGDDTIAGTEQDDVLYALSGNDTISALGGNDTLDGGAGNDSLNGGAGFDTASYASAASAVTVNLASLGAQNTGGAGTDTLSNIESLTGSAFNDTLTGDAGNNVLEGGSGNDALSGGAGSDTASYASAASGVAVSLAIAGAQNTGGAGIDTLTNFENLTGSGFNDTLTGDSNNNVLSGLAGNDLIDGGGGADTLIGGLGDDRFYIDNSGDLVVEAAGEGDDWAFVLGTYTLAQGASVETLVALNQSSTEPLVLTGNEYGQSLYGNLGDNYLNGGQGVDYLVGLAGNDNLLGGTGADHMQGGTGNDVYYVDEAGDLVTELAGEGNDILVATASYTLGAGVSVETMSAEQTSAPINLTGNELAQSLYGNAGNNILTGGGGADFMVGGAGNDVYYVDPTDFIGEDVGGGDDTIVVATSYTLREGNEIEALVALNQSSTAPVDFTGNEFGQSLYGSEGVNHLDGGAGNDYLVGEGGNDFLVGGAGNDNMAGGTGNDIYYVDSAGDQIFENAGEGDDIAVCFASFALGAGQSVETLSANEGSGAINLTGNALGQSMYGNSAANVLTSGGGADYLVGGAGNDTFVITNAPGVSTIGDYAAGDVLDITQYVSVANGTNIVTGGYVRITAAGQLQVDANGGGDAFVTVGNVSGSGSVTIRYLADGNATDLSVARSASQSMMITKDAAGDTAQHDQAFSPIAIDGGHAFATATIDPFALDTMVTHADLLILA